MRTRKDICKFAKDNFIYNLIPFRLGGRNYKVKDLRRWIKEFTDRYVLYDSVRFYLDKEESVIDLFDDLLNINGDNYTCRWYKGCNIYEDIEEIKFKVVVLIKYLK